MGTILLEGVVGSHAYGLATQASDVDTAGVFAVATEELFKLSKPEQTQVTHQPDSTYHEVEKFINLVKGCNPTAMELLWLDEYSVEHWLGRELVVLRRDFLSAKRVADAYMGYATQQLFRMKANHGRPNKEKNARHVARLLYQGGMLYANGTLELRLPNPNVIRQIGEQAAAGDMQVLNDLHKTAKEIFAGPSALPEHPNLDAIERWLVEVRYHFLTPRLKDPRSASGPERSPSRIRAMEPVKDWIQPPPAGLRP